MEKNRAVIFSKLGARVYVNPSNLGDLLVTPECLINPDMESVKGIAPHFWKPSEDLQSVIPMTPEEQAQRMLLIGWQAESVPAPEKPKEPEPAPEPIKEPNRTWLWVGLGVVVSVAIGALIWSF